MSERVAIPKSVRFEVFKRDNFTCQYCGSKAPEVVLECDHIKPVAGGGTNAIMNLVTACVDCNRGKGARTLDERHILEKQRSQVEEINERRVQLEMLSEWHQQISDEGDAVVEILAKRWEATHASTWGITDHGKDLIRKWLRRFTPEELMAAMSASWATYSARGEDGEPTSDSLEKAFTYIPRVAAVRRSEVDQPHKKRLYYVRGILRNRLRYLREQDALDLMEEAYQYDLDLDWLEAFAKRVTSWSAFRRSLEQFIEEQHGE